MNRDDQTAGAPHGRESTGSQIELHDPLLLHDHKAGHDHEEHPDERWLVSYADMMTLLFGLFVMLYSMANKFEVVQKSAQKEFSQDQTKAPVATPTPPDNREILNEVARLRDANLEMLAKIEKLQTNADIAAASLAAQVTENAVIKENARRNAAEAATLTAQLNTAANENSALRSQISAQVIPPPVPPPSKDENRELERQLDREKIRLQTAKIQELRQALEEKKRAPAQVPPEDLRPQLDAARKEIEELKKSIPQTKPFATVAITWPTKDHDIDLIVTDPEGHSFDFKHRSFKDTAGQFVLDTRRGPGAEMWQTDRLTPGIYKIKYVFYNAYGNEEPVAITGTIYTMNGAFHLPAVELDFKAKKEFVFKVEITAKGIVRILGG